MRLATTDRVYCDLDMSLDQAREMLELLKGVCAKAEHLALEDVFQWMQQQISDSIAHASQSRSDDAITQMRDSLNLGDNE